ncbi:phage recombination protein Bet [Leptospira langatensis]|uniref:phage recombination protein Bet n=1 Tax=Leptospira langatensis TaxID=2484983 RepID=UPI0014386270|nr:phage recombination protein Bet [Leptospira langatensis]
MNEQNLLSDRDKEILCNGMLKDASIYDREIFYKFVNQSGLSPFLRQIYPIWKTNKSTGKLEMSVQATIDGFRVVAERSGKYQGQTVPMYCGEDGIWKEVWPKGLPFACKVGVHVAGFKEPIYVIAKFSAYVQTTKEGAPNFIWSKMPEHMLAKCAEALALRKAFPALFSGLYTAEEMAQAENETPYKGSGNSGSGSNPPPASKPKEEPKDESRLKLLGTSASDEDIKSFFDKMNKNSQKEFKEKYGVEICKFDEVYFYMPIGTYKHNTANPDDLVTPQKVREKFEEAIPQDPIAQKTEEEIQRRKEELDDMYGGDKTPAPLSEADKPGKTKRSSPTTSPEEGKMNAEEAREIVQEQIHEALTHVDPRPQLKKILSGLNNNRKFLTSLGIFDDLFDQVGAELTKRSEVK